MRFRAICLDLDGTLLDDEASVELSVERAVEELVAAYPALDLRGLTTAYHRVDSAFWDTALRPYPDVEPVLDHFGHLPCALITNGASDTQRDKLRALRLENRFNAVVISADHGIAKPDARVF